MEGRVTILVKGCPGESDPSGILTPEYHWVQRNLATVPFNVGNKMFHR